MTQQHQDGSRRKLALRVLIVDDSRMALTVLENLLIEGGYEVAAVSGAREAIEVMRKGLHRLVITDREMPDMDGLELCHAIRSEGLAGYTYIIYQTSPLHDIGKVGICTISSRRPFWPRHRCKTGGHVV